MKIADYLKEEMIILDLKSKSKTDAINELGKVIVNSNKIRNAEEFIKEVFNREELCSTGIGNEVALPHARTDCVKSFVVAFGRSIEGIEFESIDKKPVKLIFLMGTPEKTGLKDYLHILAHINRVLQKKLFREKLLAASNASEIITLFKSVEE